LKIIVCIKQVPDTTEVEINPETNTLIREGVESIINPFDTYAIEEGVRLKEKYGGEVIVLSMGPPQVEEALKDALSVGADEAYLLSDRAFAGADTLATAYTLAAGIRKLGGADIILAGKQAIDGDTGQVGPGIAVNLNIPHITNVRKIEVQGKRVTVERLLEHGYVRLKTKLPMLATVVKEINEPRRAALRSKLKAKNRESTVWKKDDRDVDDQRLGLTGSPTWVKKIFAPPKGGAGKIFTGETEEMVSTLIGELEKDGIDFIRIKEKNTDGAD